MTMRSIRAVVPSFRPDPTELAALISSLTVAGTHPVVLANGSDALAAAESERLPLLAPGRNPGFGPSIRWAVARLDPWDWLLLVNDDIEIDGGRLGRALSSLDDSDEPQIVHLDEDVERPLPGIVDVFANVSLLARAFERLLPPRSTGSGYRSFSCVLISRGAWELTGGFDPALPFTYEDADLVRRLRERGGSVRVQPEAGVHHERSRTSSRAVADVLPIATWSALMYLRKWRLPTGGSAPLIVAAALIARIALVPFGRADRRAHLVGIGRALHAVLSGRAPSMPPYSRITP